MKLEFMCTLLVLDVGISILQENEQFRIQEAKRLERERKKKEMEEKQNGLGEKVKSKKPKQLEVEETCIVDKLMDEIRNGFPLKKRIVSNTPVNGFFPLPAR